MIKSLMGKPLKMAMGGVAAVFSIVVAYPAAGAEDVLRKSFAAEAVSKLIMDVDRGSIEIVPTDHGPLDVVVTRNVERLKHTQSAKVFEDHQVTFEQDGYSVVIRAEPREKAPPLGTVPSGNLQVHYKVSVPRRIELDVRTRGEAITVGDIVGDVMLRSSGGAIKAGIIEGKATLENSGGAIALRKAGSVSARTSAGNIELGDIDGAATAETRGGKIALERCGGDAKLQTTVGAIVVGSVSGSLHAEARAGGIRAKQLDGPVFVRGSAGHADLGRCAGPVDAEITGGNITVECSGSPKQPWSLAASAGNIKVVVSTNVAAIVDAEATGGRVRVDVPLNLSEAAQRDHVKGELNGGGETLLLKAWGGNIAITKPVPPSAEKAR